MHLMLVGTAMIAVGLIFAQASDPLEVLRNLDIEAPPHRYYERPTRDRFAALQRELEAGQATLDRSGEKAFLVSLLQALDIPASSQMLVFSTTSLQLSLISPANPRALYFNEDTYLGFIPGGKIEIISIDPELGGIFYILDIPRNAAPLKIERSRRCMNCHSGSESGYVPGLVIKSVVPGVRGGSLDAFRVDQTGHGIPLAERFGGWYLTGQHGLTSHWANAIGRAGPGDQMKKELVQPGERFSFARFPAVTSDILPQLLHEHQAGFVNEALQAAYLARTFLEASGGNLSPEQKGHLRNQARALVRYLLFAGEAALPPGMAGDAAFVADFRRERRVASNGASLKDFDLQTHLFKNRCSYMIYSPLFEALPAAVKEIVLRELSQALTSETELSDHLTARERGSIKTILQETLPAFPARE